MVEFDTTADELQKSAARQAKRQALREGALPMTSAKLAVRSVTIGRSRRMQKTLDRLAGQRQFVAAASGRASSSGRS